MSQFKTFFLGIGDAAVEEEANAFLRGHRVVKVEREWTGSGWALLAEWLEGTGSGAGGGGKWSERKVDWREALEPAAFERFARLREARKELAKEEAVPPYVVMTDAQMAEAAKADAPTMADLRKIPGWGEGRLAKYGERLLEALQRAGADGREGKGGGEDGAPGTARPTRPAGDAAPSPGGGG